ncbi:MAG TPA: selenocysteine-specific translation elongation factor [Planctomycetota bacterium]|nr:selenocysteine-specific translation elongation factor [Planctomycetota bacterium]
MTNAVFQIQPIVIGTAGHIDHGKSSLVRALTGIDPDRLKEEKERGLTIDLGFAPLLMPDGRTVGIIDVPGHERFIRNMVAGATGIDLVMLVVAADDGVMPQTREHLQIMGLLGVQQGIIVLNKIDMVPADLAELAAEDVRDAVRGTFLEGAPIVPVSALTGAGLDELKRILFERVESVRPRSSEGIFRMPIQRVFSAKGFGTIVTGIPVSGEISLGQSVEILPAAQSGKVRGIQAYGRSTDRARAGHSTALNLSDVDHHAVARGMVAAAPGFFAPVRMIGARLALSAGLDRPLADRTPIRLHTGTADPLGEVVLLDSQALEPGATGLVQLRLDDPIVCAPGDRFILRLASPSITLGGGVILEESKYRLKRFKGFVIDELSRQEVSLVSPTSLLESVLARAGFEPMSLHELAQAIKRSDVETLQHLSALTGQKRVRALEYGGADRRRWMHVDRVGEALARLRKAIEAWFEKNPLRQVVETIELKRTTDFEPELLGALLADEESRKTLSLEPGGLVRPAGRSVQMDPLTSARREKLLAAFESGGFAPPSLEELSASLGVAAPEISRLLSMLTDVGALVRINKEILLAAPRVKAAREAIVANCETHGHLEIPELRDKLGTSRKYLIPLLEYFDTQSLTIRQGANRVLRKR